VKTLLLFILLATGLCAQTANSGHAADAGAVDGTGSWPPTPTHFQTGSVTLAVGTTSYAVTFGTTMSSAPAAIVCNVYMKDANGEILYASIRADTVSTTGFTVVLSGAPTATGGLIKWMASI
jgi:hypothetical protein